MKITDTSLPFRKFRMNAAGIREKGRTFTGLRFVLFEADGGLICERAMTHDRRNGTRSLIAVGGNSARIGG
jgi:hypothetical protein